MVCRNFFSFHFNKFKQRVFLYIYSQKIIFEFSILTNVLTYPLELFIIFGVTILAGKCSLYDPVPPHLPTNIASNMEGVIFSPEIRVKTKTLMDDTTFSSTGHGDLSDYDQAWRGIVNSPDYTRDTLKCN